MEEVTYELDDDEPEEFVVKRSVWSKTEDELLISKYFDLPSEDLEELQIALPNKSKAQI